MNSFSAVSAAQTDNRGVLAYYFALVLLLATLVLAAVAPAVSSQAGASERGPSSALCRFIPQLCGGW